MPFTFIRVCVSKEFNEQTGNYYYGARYYDPKLSIFISVDPLAEMYHGYSSYAYCLNNPINLVDPTGMEADGWIKHTDDYCNKTVTYDSEINTIKQATDKGYNNVEAVFTEGTGTITGQDSEGNKITENVQFSADGSFNVDGQSYDAKSSYFSVAGVNITHSKTGGEQLMEVLHGTLDGLGTIPVLGEPFDLANAGFIQWKEMLLT